MLFRSRDLMANTVGIFTGLKDGIIAGHACIQTGGEPGAPAIGWKYSLENATPDVHIRGVTVLPIGEAVRLPSRLVNAVHTFFRCVNYSTENAGRAYRIAHNEGLTNEALAARFADLRQNPTQEQGAAVEGPPREGGNPPQPLDGHGRERDPGRAVP